MLSKRCATSAKRSGNCSSAPVPNRMACQSRCEIRVQASRRRLSSTFSRLSTPRNRAVWGWACRSAVRSSKRTAADCGRARTCPAAPAFNSPCRRSQTLRRDAAATEVLHRREMTRCAITGSQLISQSLAYLREARRCYLRWGAFGKVRQLEQLHPHLRDTPVPASPTATIGAPVEQLDVGTVVKASQAVSGEIVLGELI